MLAGRLHEAAAHHRREAERYESRDQDGHDDDCRELVKQTPENAAHEEDRDEDGGERQRHRKNGEADFASAIERRRQARLAHFHVAHDVFQHHDGVVDHEADRRA